MIQIREPGPSDLPILARIYTETRQSTFHWMPPELFQEKDFTKDTEGEKRLAAYYGKEPIGFASLWLPDNFIHHLFVAKDSQDNGVGKRLLFASLNLLGRPAKLKCATQNTLACAFYEKNGWVIESTFSTGPAGPYHVYLFR